MLLTCSALVPWRQHTCGLGACATYYVVLTPLPAYGFLGCSMWASFNLGDGCKGCHIRSMTSKQCSKACYAEALRLPCIGPDYCVPLRYRHEAPLWLPSCRCVPQLRQHLERAYLPCFGLDWLQRATLRCGKLRVELFVACARAAGHHTVHWSFSIAQTAFTLGLRFGS